MMTRVVDNPLYGRWNMMKQRCLNPNNRTEQAISTGLNYDHIEIQIDGEVNNLKRWCEIYNLPYKTIHARVKRGWDPIEAISKPIRVGDYHRNKA